MKEYQKKDGKYEKRYKPKRPPLKVKVLKKTKYWYWQLLNINGNILSSSETYSSKTKAAQTAKNVFNSIKRGYAIYEEA